MANKKMKKNLKLVNTVVNNTQKNKEEKNMKNETTGASITLTKKCVGTVVFTQRVEHGPVTYTAYGIPAVITADQVKDIVAKYVSNGWEITEKIGHKVAAPNYSKEYQKNLEKINKGTKKSDRKVTAPENPDKNEKKPTTYAEAIEQKYGSKEERTAKMQRKNQLWNEMSAVIRAEVQKSGKYLRKDAWKNEMYNRLEKNPEWVEIVGLRAKKA